MFNIILCLILYFGVCKVLDKLDEPARERSRKLKEDIKNGW